MLNSPKVICLYSFVSFVWSLASNVPNENFTILAITSLSSWTTDGVCLYLNQIVKWKTIAWIYGERLLASRLNLNMQRSAHICGPIKNGSILPSSLMMKKRSLTPILGWISICDGSYLAFAHGTRSPSLWSIPSCANNIKTKTNMRCLLYTSAYQCMWTTCSIL